MLGETMQTALNKQVTAELYSGYLYLSMAANFERLGLKGAAQWMRAQSKEELLHAMKLYEYVIDRGGRVTLGPIEGPPTKWDSALATFQDAYEHETKVTAMINDLVNLAIQEKDHATNSYLQWFVDEQVEEEASADEVVQKLKLVGDGGGLFMVDRELGTRVHLFVLPITGTEAQPA
jgi:ferritin